MTSVGLGVLVSLGGIIGLASVGMVWIRLSSLSLGRRVLLSVLRGIAVGCLLLMMVNPIGRQQEVVSIPPHVVVLIDESSSMGVPDAPGKITRYEWARRLAHSLHFLGTPDKQPQVTRLGFGLTVKPFRAGAPTATGTNIDNALRATLWATPSSPPDAVVLLSDGAANHGPEAQETLSWCQRTRVPIYAIGLGSTRPPADAWIARIDVPRSVKVGTSVIANVVVASRGLEGAQTRVRLSGPSASQEGHSVTLSESRNQRVQFSFRHNQPGFYRYQVSLTAVHGEWTPLNNSRTFFLRVTPGQRRLLCVAERPSLELKFIRRALDPLSEMCITWLVARSEGGWSQLDVPTRFQSFPKNHELARYDAIILENIATSAFSSSTLQAMADFVSRRGGGLAVLGGDCSFGAGDYNNSPLAAALGVRLAAESGYSAVPAKVQRAPNIGDTPPVSSIERHQQFPGWLALPLIGDTNEIVSTRPGASVMLQTEAGAPLLVVQRYGAGRTLCLLTSGTHRWYLSRDATDASRRGHQAFWQVLAQWLTTPPNRTPVALEIDRQICQAGEAIRLSVQVSDMGFQPVSGAHVGVHVNGPKMALKTVNLSEVVGAPGCYENSMTLPEKGTYTLTATAVLGENKLGTDSQQVVVEASSAELTDPTQNASFLRALAEASGGAYRPAQQVTQLPRLLRLAPHPREFHTALAWGRNPWALLILTCLLGIDWFLRRWWGVG